MPKREKIVREEVPQKKEKNLRPGDSERRLVILDNPIDMSEFDFQRRFGGQDISPCDYWMRYGRIPENMR